MTPTSRQILTLAKSGLPNGQIAQKVGCSKAYVSIICGTYGVMLRRAKRIQHAGTIPVRHFFDKKSNAVFHSIHIPNTALRAAGLLQETSVQFHVEPTSTGHRIIVERISTTKATEPTKNATVPA